MNFLSKSENKLSKEFLEKGYVISKVESKNSLKIILNLVLRSIQKKIKDNKINLNNIHKLVPENQLNEFRLGVINDINKNKILRYHYFKLATSLLYSLAGNELMMQKNINLSIQFPNDKNSLLPIHSDVWSGDSAYEINLWVPLVNCYKTKSMYILEQKYNDVFLKKMKSAKIKSSDDIFKIVKNKIKWLDVNYGECLIFNQGLPHGNVVNKEIETRWSMNCRFKSVFSPYGDKKIAEFFLPITTRAMTEVGMSFEYPFKNR
jgi:sporadic carbohydrate cluster 2OG-Fe(II) oxygenase